MKTEDIQAISIELPDEIWLKILSNLSNYKDWLSCRRVSKQVKKAAEDHTLWVPYFLSDVPKANLFQKVLDAMQGLGEWNSYFDVLYLAKCDLAMLRERNETNPMPEFLSKPEIQSTILNNKMFTIQYSGVLYTRQLMKDQALTYIQKGGSVAMLSDEMKDNDNVVYSAVSKRGSDLGFASNRLKSDPALAVKASETVGIQVLAYVSIALRDDPSFIQSVLDSKSSIYAPSA